jgi:hypothetical protein
VPLADTVNVAVLPAVTVCEMGWAPIVTGTHWLFAANDTNNNKTVISVFINLVFKVR